MSHTFQAMGYKGFERKTDSHVFAQNVSGGLHADFGRETVY